MRTQCVPGPFSSSSKALGTRLISPLLSVSRCIHFPQSGSVHCIHSCTNWPSIKSSSYSPKQVAHSLLEISASCSPPLIVRLLLFSLFADFSSAFRRLLASLASAFFFFISSLSCLFLSLRLFSLSLFRLFYSSSSLRILFLLSLSASVALLPLLISFFLSFSSIKAIAVALVKIRGPFDAFVDCP